MKGISHFMCGVASASFFAKGVEMAAAEKSWIMILGGLFGIMADTLDFKVYAFFSKEEHEIDPDPLHPDAGKIAEQIGRAIEQAYDEKRLIKIKCQTVRLGADLWRQYVIKFDPEPGQVTVVFNPIVTTSQIPYLGTEPKENRVGRYKLRVPLIEKHGRPTVVDIMNGPQIGFRRVGEAVEMEFIPFHRTWTHSFFVGLLAAVAATLIATLAVGWNRDGWGGWYYGLVALVAYWSHLISDLTGYMGASFFWPFWKKRTPGLKWFKAQNPHSNFIFNYTCLVVTLYNLNRFTFIDQINHLGNWVSLAPMKLFGAELGFALFGLHLYLPHYFFYTWVVPLAVYGLLVKIFGEKKGEGKEALALAEEAMDEEEQIQGEVG